MANIGVKGGWIIGTEARNHSPHNERPLRHNMLYGTQRHKDEDANAPPATAPKPKTGTETSDAPSDLRASTAGVGISSRGRETGRPAPGSGSEEAGDACASSCDAGAGCTLSARYAC